MVGLCRNHFPDTPYARAYGTPADQEARATAYQAAAGTTWRYEYTLDGGKGNDTLADI